MRRNTVRVMAGGGPVDWLGANFWSRTGGPLMWRHYDPAVITAELAVLKRHGLTMTRSFFYWPDFMPGPYEIDETMTERFADFLDRHTEQGLVTVPTFIVGHMSGENWDPAWRNDRHLYNDVWMVGRQAWFAGAVRAPGGQQPFSLGDGAWGIEVTGKDNGFRLTEVAEITDFLGPHTYPVGDDPVRQRYAAAIACELSGTFGKPVIMEELGVSSDFASDANAATYYRHVLHSTLLAGASGWIAWNNPDFALPHQDPCRHHAFELNFGLTDAHGTPKATLTEMKSFAQTLKAIDHTNCERADTDTALIVSAYLDNQFPFTSPDSHVAVARGLHQSYIVARLADLPPKLTRETDGIEPGARLYLAPSVKQFLAPTAATLERLAADGATVYVSYCAGDVSWHRGPSYGAMNELFGTRHQLDVGLVDPITDELVELTLARDFGGLSRGTALTVPVAGNEHARSYLPVLPPTAEVIATDAHGRPAILRRQTGRGALLLCTYPLEYMASAVARGNPGATRGLSSALATHAGIRRTVTVEDPDVACDVLVHRDGTRYAVIVSHADETLTVKPTLSAAGELAPPLGLTALGGTEVTDTVTLHPFGVKVFKIAES